MNYLFFVQSKLPYLQLVAKNGVKMGLFEKPPYRKARELVLPSQESIFPRSNPKKIERHTHLKTPTMDLYGTCKYIEVCFSPKKRNWYSSFTAVWERKILSLAYGKPLNREILRMPPRPFDRRCCPRKHVACRYVAG